MGQTVGRPDVMALLPCSMRDNWQMQRGSLFDVSGGADPEPPSLLPLLLELLLSL